MKDHARPLLHDVSARVNERHKDRLFGYIFGNPANKEWTLRLYNAVSGGHHEDPEIIEITTMDDVLYMGMKNDLSFIVMDVLNIYEEQSTFNPNMPVRELMYAGRLYDKYIHVHRLNVYSSSIVRLPVPKLVVFYNGREEKEDRILRLQDAFSTDTERGDIDVRVRMININAGHNRELMDRCRPLAEYSWLIERIRRNGKTMEINDAVDQAMEAMPVDYEIRTFLLGNRAEVKNMCITEYNEAETMELFKEEWLAEGKERGMAEGVERGMEVSLLSSVKNLMETLSFTAQQAMDALKIPREQQGKYARML